MSSPGERYSDELEKKIQELEEMQQSDQLQGPDVRKTKEKAAFPPSATAQALRTRREGRYVKGMVFRYPGGLDAHCLRSVLLHQPAYYGLNRMLHTVHPAWTNP